METLNKTIYKLELLTGDKLYTHGSPEKGYYLMATTRSHINGLYTITQARTLDTLHTKVKKILRQLTPRK